METQDAPDFEELVAALRSANAGVGAADLHGSLCGFLVAGGGGIAQFLDAMSLPELAGGDAPALALQRLFERSGVDLASDDYRFEPLLPDGERPVAERTQALLQWCQGFIGGLGLGGMRDERALSDDGREVLRDLAEIARSKVSHDEDDEVDETALAELTEFARVGALLLRSELRAAVGSA